MKDRKTIFIFPGQGSQFTGMALDFYDSSPAVRRLFETASGIYEADMKKLISEGPDEALRRTNIAQPAVHLANLSCARYLQEKGITPAGAAGHSLGEYAALCICSVISEEDSFRLVRARSEAMNEAIEDLSRKSGGAGGMAAVLGLPPEKVEALVNGWREGGLEDIYAANFNSPGQTVISGALSSLEKAGKMLKENGARRVIPLKVAGPFHSPLMGGAALKFKEALRNTAFNNAALPFFSNVTGERAEEAGELAALAFDQITAPVRWTREEAAITALAPGLVLETGPGAVLCGLWKESGSPVQCLPAGSVPLAGEIPGVRV